ncbi:MAG: biopolymer transporter ExbD [Thermodesulfobacteriota bacterium]
MGMQTGGREGRTVMSEINVTPFVDVMLVLLIIFMVTTPILYQGIWWTNLLKQSGPIPSLDREESRRHATPAGAIFIEKDEYSLNELSGEVQKLITERGADIRNEEVFLRADTGVSYGKVVEVMTEIRNAGVEKLGLITEPVPSN